MLKKLLFIWLGTALFANALAQQIQPVAEQAWIELGDNGAIIARAIVSHQQCPTAIIDGQRLNMSIRAAASKHFPVTTCELLIPKAAQQVTINKQLLALPKQNPKRIVIIGDTGCRLKFLNTQACNDPLQWPFAKIIQQAVNFKPDLVVHVGDYYYRETPCVANKGCAHSAYGDNWRSWNADFFRPAKPLLTVAPWVFARGNHEACDRGGAGWFRFLAIANYKAKICEKHSQPFVVPIGKEQLFVMDSSSANDAFIVAEQVQYLQPDFVKLNQQTRPTWLITHKPLWTTSVLRLKDINPEKSFITSLQQASMNQFSTHVKMILSGHVHLFQTINIAGRPAQVIIGNSGTQLESFITKPNLAGLMFSNAMVESGINITQFGYLTLELTPQGWIGQMRDVEAKVLAECALKQQQFLCKKSLELNSLSSM